jgi:hypothetical protein
MGIGDKERERERECLCFDFVESFGREINLKAQLVAVYFSSNQNEFLFLFLIF